MPSGSGANRWLTCPGSHVAEQGQPDKSGDDAAEGELLHEILAGKREPIDITEDQAAFVTYTLHERDKLVTQLLGDGAEIVDKDQTRYWLRNGDLEPIASCKLDYIAKATAKMLVIDYKGGRREVDQADTNAQLRFAAAVCWQEFRPEQLFVAIIQPRAEGERVTVASYDPQAMEAALIEMTEGSQRAALPNQKRKPDVKACHYCKARGTERCPESIKTVSAMVEASTAATLLITPENALEWFGRVELAERICESLRDRLKTMAEAGQAPGLRLKPGNTIKSISDPRAAWAKIGINIGGAAFADCCKVSLPELSKAFRKQYPEITSEKSAREKVEALLVEAGALQEKTNAPSLAREVKAA